MVNPIRGIFCSRGVIINFQLDIKSGVPFYRQIIDQIKSADASGFYKDNPAALHLHAMKMVFEGLKQKGSMIIVPGSAVETMGLGAMGGPAALDRIMGKGDDEQENESRNDETAK